LSPSTGSTSALKTTTKDTHPTTSCAGARIGACVRTPFNLAEYIEVESAAFENGLLHVNLVRRMPDKMKPRKIAIGNVAQLNAKGTRKAA
jgi:hypothetical protein